MKTPHPHAELLRAIADGETISSFEACYMEGDYHTVTPGSLDALYAYAGDYCVRRKPRTIRIGNTEVVAGITEAPNEDTIVWIASPSLRDYYMHTVWQNLPTDIVKLSRGFLHLSQKNAEAMGRALAALTEHGESE